MTDIIYIILLSTVMWFTQIATEYERNMAEQLAIYDQNMAVLWLEAEATTNRLKQCKKEKKWKH